MNLPDLIDLELCSFHTEAPNQRIFHTWTKWKCIHRTANHLEQWFWVNRGPRVSTSNVKYLNMIQTNHNCLCSALSKWAFRGTEVPFQHFMYSASSKELPWSQCHFLFDQNNNEIHLLRTRESFNMNRTWLRSS